MAEKSAKVSQPKDYKLVIEKDVKIPLRDGTVLYADIFRPDGGSERFPAIITTGPYMKDKLWVPPPDLEEAANPHMNWETANPLWWCPRGYGLLRVDSRGSGKSPGKSEPSSYQEALDTYDCIEWLAKLGWCNGNVGALGISYHANFQWRVAGLQPPSLKAIMPWEGRADQYRDQAYHGGIFAMGFLTQWWLMQAAHHLLGEPRSYNPDAFNNNLLWDYMRNDLDSGYWRTCSAQWDRITVPVYTVGNWGGFAMHLRGNTEGLHARGVEAQEAAHPQRLALPPFPFRGRPPRSAALVRSLAERNRHRHHGRAAGEARDPHRRQHEAVSVPLRGRLADPAHGVDEALSAAAERDGGRRRRRRRHAHAAGARQSDEDHVRSVAGRASFSRRAHRRVVRNAADGAGHRSDGPDRAQRLGLEQRERHGYLRDDPQHRSRRQGRVRSRAARRFRAGRDERVAARFAPQARSRKIAAVPAVSRARRALVAQARRDRRVPGRSLADVDGLQERAQAAPRHRAERRRGHRPLHALPRGLQPGSEEHAARRRRPRFVSAAAHHSAWRRRGPR